MADSRGMFKQAVKQYLLSSSERSIPYGIGTAWLGRGETDDLTVKREAEVLSYAYNVGFRYFDTSIRYGESERVVGEFVVQVPRDSIFLSSKVYIAEDSEPAEAALHVRQSLERSLEKLQTDYLDLFQIHDADSLGHIVAAGGALEELMRLREGGTIRRVGLATRDLELHEAAVKHGQFDTILTYMDYSPVGTEAESVMRLAGRSGVGVINGSPLLFGLLVGGDPGEIEVPPDQLQHRARQSVAVKLYELCQSEGVSLLAAALQFPTRQPLIDISLSGPASIKEVENLFQALHVDIPDTFWKQAAGLL